MKRYIILYHGVFLDRDWERLGCTNFAADGFVVTPVECAGLFGAQYCSGDESRSEKLRQVLEFLQNRSDALAFLEKVTAVDFVLVAIPLNAATSWLFDLLGQLKIRYAVATLGALPKYGPLLARIPGWRARSLFVMGELRNRLSSWRQLGREWLRLRGSRATTHGPAFWIRGAARPGALDAPWPRLWWAKSLWARSIDADTFHDKARRNLLPSDLPARFAVFVDDGFSGHPDFVELGIRAPVSENYRAEMEAFFSKFKQESSLPVIVALHPRSNSSGPQGVLAYRGLTVELVEQAALVIAHCSTAISFAVLARRPLMFVTTSELSASAYGPLIGRMAAWFDQAPVNVSNPLSKIHYQPSVIESGRYVRYEREFLCANADERLWPAVIRQISITP